MFTESPQKDSRADYEQDTLGSPRRQWMNVRGRGCQARVRSEKPSPGGYRECCARKSRRCPRCIGGGPAQRVPGKVAAGGRAGVEE